MTTRAATTRAAPATPAGFTAAARLGAAALGLGVGTVGAGLAGVGWFYSSLILDTRRVFVHPERVISTEEAPGGRTVTLVSSRIARQPGTWGLRWADGLARMGPVVAEERGWVRRPLLGGALPPAGVAAALDAGPWDPDPAARGLAFTEIVIDTPVGPAPAWFVPAPPDGTADTWVIAVHGRGGRRREALRVLPALHRAGLSVLVVSYRNDIDAPPSPDGFDHLGDTEWEDVAAALRLALSRGARRIVLYGWSMGGAITGQLLDRAPEADAVAAVVWDAPLVDWRATLRRQARSRRLPPGLTPLATGVTGRRIGIDFDRFDLRRRPPARRPPTLILHSAADTAVPVTASRALAEAAPGLDWPVRYVEVPEVEHTASWNADPEAYESTVTSFLAEVLSGPGGRLRSSGGAGTMGS